MLFLKNIFLFLFLFLINHPLYALSVPFLNVNLAKGAQLQASFSFGSNAEIFCYAPDLITPSKITWPYKGKISSGQLPILLATTSSTTGELSDPNGVLTITNTTTSKLQISCQFGLFHRGLGKT